MQKLLRPIARHPFATPGSGNNRGVHEEIREPWERPLASRFRDRFGIVNSHRARSTPRVACSTGRAIRAVNFIVATIFCFFPETAKNHFSCCYLQNTRNGNVRILTYQPTRVVDHNHRSIVEISDTLVVLFSLFKDEDTHCLTWEDNRLESICQLINVEHVDATQLRDFVQVEVIRHYYRIKLFP